MDIHTIIGKISRIEGAMVSIGKGPTHPTAPDTALQEIVKDYWEQFPFLKQL